jgi:hypothetical protein
MSVEVVLLVGMSHMSHNVTQYQTEKVANNLKTRLFSDYSRIVTVVLSHPCVTMCDTTNFGYTT